MKAIRASASNAGAEKIKFLVDSYMVTLHFDCSAMPVV